MFTLSQKMLGATLVFVALIAVSYGDLHCPGGSGNVPKEWITMTKDCNQAMTNQVQVELTAAMTYMAMGAHFARDTINRPGFADYFFKSASEEREHAIKIIEYLLMRGKLTGDSADFDENKIDPSGAGVESKIHQLIMNPQPKATVWSSGLDALENALKLETNVTDSIRSIIVTCEDALDNERKTFNDYHLSDYLTGDFLTEQYEGQRQLAGMISTLSKMMHTHGPIGEFLYDKKLLEV